MRLTILILIWCGLMAFADLRLFAADTSYQAAVTLTSLRQECPGGICPMPANHSGATAEAAYGDHRPVVRATGRVIRGGGRIIRGAGRVLLAPFRLFRGCRGGRCG